MKKMIFLTLCLLTSFCKINCMSSQRPRYYTSLWEACKRGELRGVELLIKCEDSSQLVNKPDIFGATPLHYTCQNDNLQITHFLLEHGAQKSLDILDKYHKTPLWWACKNKNLQMIELLLKYNTPTVIPNNLALIPIDRACYGNYPLTVKLLLKNDADIHIHDEYDRTLLYFACYNNNLQMAKTILTYYGKKNCIQELVNKKHNKNNSTPLSVACYYNNLQIVELLLKNNAKQSINEANIEGKTPLYLACHNNNPQIVRLLLANGGKQSVNIASHIHKITPICQACCHENPEILKLLLQHGAQHSVNSPDIYGQTPLYLACFYNRIENIKLLLKNGAQKSVNTPDNNGQTPLFCAYHYNNLKMAQILIENGATVTEYEIAITRDISLKKYLQKTYAFQQVENRFDFIMQKIQALALTPTIDKEKLLQHYIRLAFSYSMLSIVNTMQPPECVKKSPELTAFFELYKQAKMDKIVNCTLCKALNIPESYLNKDFGRLCKRTIEKANIEFTKPKPFKDSLATHINGKKVISTKKLYDIEIEYEEE